MNKKNLYYKDAEQLYVVEQMSIRKTAAKLRLAPSTIFRWKKAGEWGKKREEHLNSRHNLQKEFCEFGGKLFCSINEEFNRDKKINIPKMYALAKIFPLLMKIIWK